MHRAAAVPDRRVPLDHRRRPIGAPTGHPSAGSAQPLRRPRPADRLRASTTGAASRRSPPTTSIPSGPGRLSPVLRNATEAAGFTLAPRLTLYPEFALDPDRWLDEPMRFPVLDASDAEGLGRDHPWCSGGEVPPPLLLVPALGDVDGPVGVDTAPAGGHVTRHRRSAVADVLAGVALGKTGGRGRDRHPVRGPGPPRCGRWPKWPTSSAPRPSATR